MKEVFASFSAISDGAQWGICSFIILSIVFALLSVRIDNMEVKDEPVHYEVKKPRRRVPFISEQEYRTMRAELDYRYAHITDNSLDDLY